MNDTESIEICNTSCCGVVDISGITEQGVTPKSIIKDICYERIVERKGFAFAIFTDICRQNKGKALAKFILDNNLGTITESKSKVNPNSRNPLKIWTWAVDQKRLSKYWDKIIKD